MSNQDGGAAFPQSQQLGQICVTEGGMSLRDYFAAKAMAAMTPIYWDEYDSYESGVALNKCLAETAYEMADAMLAAREVSK